MCILLEGTHFFTQTFGFCAQKIFRFAVLEGYCYFTLQTKTDYCETSLPAYNN